MAKNAPGKHYRDGISLTKLIRMFPDDEAARGWFETQIWPHGPHCPKCGSVNVQSNIKHKTMTHRCRECYSGKDRNSRTMFSLKTGNIMEGSKLGYQTWAIAIYLVTTSLKGVSLHAASPRSGNHAKERVASGTPSAEGHGRRPASIRRTYRGGRGLSRWEA